MASSTLGVRGEHQDPDLGQLSPDHTGRVEAFGLVLGRHANVDDHEVGLLIADDAQQLGGVARLARDLEPRALEQPRDALAQQDVIVRHHDALCGPVSAH